jgi:RimJ/RimL family protein N-acetyltransferase
MTMTADSRTCLRRATAADCELVFRWRNDPAIVALSQSRQPVDPAAHRKWFTAALADPDRLMLIIEADGEPVGQLRFDRSGRENADITIYLVGDNPGHGHGSRAMTLGEMRAMQQWPQLRRLQAVVLASNARSLGYFAKMGFARTQIGDADSDGSMVRLQKVLPVMQERWSSAKQRIAQYYDDLVGHYGDDSRSCDYGRETSQHAKFRAISEIMPLAGKRLLDVGCGLAHFLDYLDAHGIAVDYHGIDISEAMLARARGRHPHLNLRQLDILDEDPGRYDVVTANGIFYLLGEDGEALMPRLVARMYELADHALAFNSLSAWASEQQPGEFYADPAWVLNFCRKITPWSVIRHDYLPHDFTVYLYREQR